MEVRDALGSTVRDVDQSKRQVLMSVPHDVVDTYKTTFTPECFRASLVARKPLMCWQHDLKEPIGRVIEAQTTSRSNEMVGQLSDFNAVPLARRAFTQIADGTLTDVSFGFNRISDEPHPEHRGVTRITRATMHEVSPVSIGSIPGASAVGVRHGAGGDFDEHNRTMAIFQHYEDQADLEDVFFRNGVASPAEIMRARRELSDGTATRIRQRAGATVESCAADAGVPPAVWALWESGRATCGDLDAARAFWVLDVLREAG